MKKLKDGFTYYQSKKDLLTNGKLSEEQYDFLNEVKRSCAFYFYDNNLRFVITASYANADKTSPEYFISDLLMRKREQVSELESAKKKILKMSGSLLSRDQEIENKFLKKNLFSKLFAKFQQLKNRQENADVIIENNNRTVIEEVIETFVDIEIGTVFTTREIKEMVSKKFGRNEGSIIPSDYSYNMMNKGIMGTASEHFNIFVQTKRGEYEYVGLDYDGNFGTGKTTDIGYINKNNQRNNGKKCKSNNHYNQWFYELECLNCGHKYNANGSDIWIRKCPNCQVKNTGKFDGHKTTRDIPDRLRYKVLKRDNFKCCACGASPAKDSSVELHIDHIIPWSKGGETTLDNLQVLCSKCNLGKSDL